MAVTPPPPGLYSILLNLNFIFLKRAKSLRGNPRPTLEGTVTSALNYQRAQTKFSPFAVIRRLNPRTYTQSYTLTVVQWAGGVGVDGSSPYFDFAFSGKPLTLILYKMKYILCVVALLKVCNVTKRGNHLAFLRTRNRLKTVTFNNFLRLTSKTTHK